MKKRNHVLGIASALLLVAVSVVVPAASSSAEPEPDSEIAGLVDSAKAGGPSFITGVITDLSGAPAPEGQLVTIQAWPAQQTLSALKDGEAVKKLPVGYALTAADGSFDLKVSAAGALNQYKNRDGVMNFEVVSFGPDYLSAYMFPATPESDAKSRKPIALTPVIPIEPRFIDEQDGISKGCLTTKKSSLGPVWVSVGYGYIASGATMKFSYTSGASSQVGVGISASGIAGTFTASGTSSVSSTATVTFPSTNGFKVWKTQFVYGKYNTLCIVGAFVVDDYYTAVADSYAGGTSVQTVTGYPTANYCNSYVSGSSFTKSTTAAYTSSVGAATSSLLGVNLSATTGYSSAAKLTFTSTAARSICGTTGYPGGSPSRLVVK